MPLVAERNHTQKNGVVASFLQFLLRFLLFWWLLLKSTSACLGFQGPGGGSGAVGEVWAPQARKNGAVAFWGRFCSSLWPSLGQVTCTGQPPHRRGRVSPDKRVPPLPWWWSHSNPNPPNPGGVGAWVVVAGSRSPRGLVFFLRASWLFG